MKKKKILIVGGTGFIGFHLVKKCVSKKWEVDCISTKLPSKDRKVKNARYIIADISKRKNLEKRIKSYYNFVVNLGGYVDHSNKTKTFKSHYIGCKNLYEVFKTKKPRVFIQMGSSLEYGPNISPLKEDFKCYPTSIYGKSKLLATKFLLKKSYENNFPVVVLRLFQAYGPFQDINRLIPIVIKACIKNKSFACSSGYQLRDFIYIDDVINLILISIKNKNAKGNIFNVGLGKPKKVRQVIYDIRSIVNKGKPQFGKIKMRKDEIKNIYANINKAKKVLKWRPKTIFKKGIKKTIKYYKKYGN